MNDKFVAKSRACQEVWTYVPRKVNYFSGPGVATVSSLNSSCIELELGLGFDNFCEGSPTSPISYLVGIFSFGQRESFSAQQFVLDFIHCATKKLVRGYQYYIRCPELYEHELLNI